MRRILKDKSVWMKLIIILFVIIGFQVATPSNAYAIDYDVAENIGGKLLNPVMSFLASLGDGVIGILQENIMGLETSMITVGSDIPGWLKIIATIVAVTIAVAIAIVASAAIVAFGAEIAAALGVVASTTMGVGTIVTSALGGALAGIYVSNELTPEEFDLPLFSYSAEEIFQNHILLFNVDFFNTDSRELYVECERTEEQVIVAKSLYGIYTGYKSDDKKEKEKSVIVEYKDGSKIENSIKSMSAYANVDWYIANEGLDPNTNQKGDKEEDIEKIKENGTYLGATGTRKSGNISTSIRGKIG
jgi:hypothetical protein